MKKYSKLFVILLITVIFIFPIKRVRAEEKQQVKCIYRLPFSGINVSTGEYMGTGWNNFKCYDATDEVKKNCYVEAQISNTHTENNKCLKPASTSFGATNNNGDAQSFLSNYYSGWTKQKNAEVRTDGYGLIYNQNPTGTYLSEISTTEDCPKYIWISKNTLTDKQNQEYSKTIFNSFKYGYRNDRDSCYFTDLDTAYLYPTGQKLGIYYKGSNTGGFDNAVEFVTGGKTAIIKTKMYNPSSKDERYETFLKSFYNANVTSNGDGSFNLNEELTNILILPLYQVAGGKNETSSGDTNVIDEKTSKSGEKIASVMRIYRDTVGKAWGKKLNEFQTDLKSKCGNNWEKYINVKTYNSSDFTSLPSSITKTGSVSKMLRAYSKLEYVGDKKNNRNEIDKEMSDECWNSRSKLMDAFDSFELFMFNIGVTKKGQTSSVNNYYFDAFYLDKSDYENDFIDDWLRLNYFFEAIEFGTDQKIESYTSDDERVTEKKEMTEECKRSSYAKEIHYDDRCAYLCSDKLTENEYKKCVSDAKSNNTEYAKCNSALKKCNVNISCISNKGNPSYTECHKQLDAALNNNKNMECMNKLITGFSSNNVAAYRKEVDAFNKCKTEYDSQTMTFGFIFTGDDLELSVNFNKYHQKCTDVAVFTEIWSVISVAAPFLLIIFGAIDYFKAVMASDLEQMKKAKKKFPVRLIAFLIFLMLPVILRLILKFGTNRAGEVNYIRCILSGDTKSGS